MPRRLFRPFAAMLAIATTVLAASAAIAETDYVTVGQPEDKVVISSGVDVVSLDPLDVVAIIPDRMLMNQISDPLIRTDKNGKLIPWLATSWKNIDPLTWEIKLRKGVKFQDGEPFNAQAVKFFFDLMRDPNFKSPAKSNFNWTKSVDVVDDYTIRIHTAKPDPVAPGRLTLAAAVPPGYIKKVGIDGYRKHPIGTGPYKFVEHVRDDHITFEAFDGWWPGKPKIKTLIYRPIKEPAARVAALLAGEIDLAFDVPPELIPTVEQSKTAKIKRALSVRTYFLFLNTINPAYPTTKREVRAAINYAIDRDSLNKNILGGTGAPAAWLNPHTFGIDPSLKPIPYDPAKAKKLLAEAGYPNGVDLDFDAFQGRYIKDKELAEAITGQLAKVGIRAHLKINDWGVYVKKMWSHKSAPIDLLAWVDNVGDPDVQNYRVLQTGGNWSQNSDPKLDKLMAQIASEMDPEKRKALIMEQQHYMRHSFPIAYLLQIGIICGVSPKMAWWEPEPNDGHEFYQVKAINK